VGHQHALRRPETSDFPMVVSPVVEIGFKKKGKRGVDHLKEREQEEREKARLGLKSVFLP